MSERFDSDTVLKAMASPRWSALVRTDLDAAGVIHWDPAS